jgi:isoleucyl-tRNA synthetase
VSDRIDLWWAAGDDEVALALTEHGATVADEVLAVTFSDATGSGLPTGVAGLAVTEEPELGLSFALRRARP